MNLILASPAEPSLKCAWELTVNRGPGGCPACRSARPGTGARRYPGLRHTGAS